MRTIFEDVRLIDGVAAEPRDGLDVVVDGERIAAVVPHGTLSAPLSGEPPATIIAGRGRTLLPGLIDAHAHYTFDPTEGSIATIAGRSDAEILLAAAGHAARALRAGTTTARGAGSIRNLELVLRDAIAAGRVPGPRLVAAGAAIGITGGHGHQFGIEADGRRRADRCRSAPDPRWGGRHQDRRVGGGDAHDDRSRARTDRPRRPRADRIGDPRDRVRGAPAAPARHEPRPGFGVGHRVGRARASTASSTPGWPTARPSKPSPRPARVLVPTLIVTDVNRELSGLTPVQRERQDLIERRHRASCEAAIELGVPLATGTDTGEVGVTSDMVWREIVLLRDHGMSAMAAIAAATSVGARLLGLDDEIGTSNRASAPISCSSRAIPLADLAGWRAPCR